MLSLKSSFQLIWAGQLILTGAFLIFTGTSCTSAYIESIGGDTTQVFQKIYLTDFNTAWQSALEALKTSPLDISNRESGFILTKWTDNTNERNFSDSFANTNAYLKAQYRFHLLITKGFYNGQPTIKIGVQKEQLVQVDVLEGWRPIESDSIDENTLLYRIGRIIYIKMKLAKLEDERAKKAAEDANF